MVIPFCVYAWTVPSAPSGEVKSRIAELFRHAVVQLDVAVSPTASVALILKLNVPVAVGVPVIVPLPFNVKPVGNDPEPKENVYGPVPPLALKAAKYATPTCPDAGGHDTDNGVIPPFGNAGTIAVTSIAAFVVPPTETVAVFATDGAALAATLTVTVMGEKLEPAASASVRVHTSVPSTHVQPEPEIAVAVRPGGSVSLTVTMPLVAAVPTLLTISVYVLPVSPSRNTPVWFL